MFNALSRINKNWKQLMVRGIYKSILIGFLFFFCNLIGFSFLRSSMHVNGLFGLEISTGIIVESFSLMMNETKNELQIRTFVYTLSHILLIGTHATACCLVWHFLHTFRITYCTICPYVNICRAAAAVVYVVYIPSASQLHIIHRRTDSDSTCVSGKSQNHQNLHNALSNKAKVSGDDYSNSRGNVNSINIFALSAMWACICVCMRLRIIVAAIVMGKSILFIYPFDIYRIIKHGHWKNYDWPYEDIQVPLAHHFKRYRNLWVKRLAAMKHWNY